MSFGPTPNDPGLPITVGQLPASVVTGSSHYDLGKDAFGNMAVGSVFPSIVPGGTGSQNAGYNTAYGGGALDHLTRGSLNSAFGHGALQNFTTSSYAQEPAGGENSAFGEGALTALTDGYWNTALGRGALGSNVHDVRNTAVGWNALTLAVSGGAANSGLGDNTAVGAEAGDWITTGLRNTAIGSVALGGTNTPITGNNNTAVGFNSMTNFQGAGSNNTALGASALQGVAAQNIGNENVALGDSTLLNVATGSYNVAAGRNSGPSGDHSFTVSIGRNIAPSGWGGVAIGNDSGGGVATAAQDVFALGTATHRVKISNNATGAGTPAFGSNCPATTLTAPYTWFRMMAGDGSIVYVPAWK